jgi:adenosine deaminase
MIKNNSELVYSIYQKLTKIISETNAIDLDSTLELAHNSMLIKETPVILKEIHSFRTLLSKFHQDEASIEDLLEHTVSEALFLFFKNFPLRYQEEHIHLTGSLDAEFIYPRLKKLLEGPNKSIYEKKIQETYGMGALPLKSVEDVDRLIRLADHQRFEDYLKILLIPKLILIDKETHIEAAYHMASKLYHEYNVGRIRLKFSFSRDSAKEEDAIPGLEEITPEEVVLGLYEGFQKFKDLHPDFDYILSPSFRKEPHFYDPKKFRSKKDFFLFQVESILKLIEKYPFLKDKLINVDTVGSEKELYRKTHFEEMRLGFRKLHYKGFQLRSHHGETWHTLRKGVQAVDNSMNIWHIDTLEHGLSLGLNPNYYFHSLFERVMEQNNQGIGMPEKSHEALELMDMDWNEHPEILLKLLHGEKLNQNEINYFIKTKFHTAREIEHYQHDVLNRMINKNVSLIALPSSNNKLTQFFPDFKDHPFSWWEKKGVRLGVGTDNYITLSTNLIKEMLILLFTDSTGLKITKLLMVVTGEYRRPYVSQLLWQMRKKKI